MYRTLGKVLAVSAQRITTGALGRGRRFAPQTSPQKLEEDVYAAAREKREADQRYKQAVKKAKAGGVIIDTEETLPIIDFKLRLRHLHMFPYGLENPDHDHWVVEFSSELSPECIAELKEKVMNGKVTLARDVYRNGRWQVIHCEDEPSMAAD